MRMDFYGISKGIIKNFEENLKNKNSACILPFYLLQSAQSIYSIFRMAKANLNFWYQFNEFYAFKF